MVASDWANMSSSASYTPCELQSFSWHIAQALEQQGGKKKASKPKGSTSAGPKATNERYLGKVVYKGKLGGKYVMVKGKLTSLSKLTK